jgi:hypothetical protein
MAERGTLEKVLIQAFASPDFSGTPVATFEAYVNPSEITVGYEVEFDEAQGSGTTGARMSFKKIKPGDLTLAFFLDGTGANGQPLDVQKKVDEFQNITGYNGGSHHPNYLKIGWGTLTVKRCVLKSLSVAYKLFQPNGVPLRAVLTAVFIDASDDQTRVAMAQDQSPDLTHVRLIKAGDSLPRLCQEIYGDPRLYLAVAAANGIDQPRALVPGARVVFPPLEK